MKEIVLSLVLVFGGVASMLAYLGTYAPNRDCPDNMICFQIQVKKQ